MGASPSRNAASSIEAELATACASLVSIAQREAGWKAARAHATTALYVLPIILAALAGVLRRSTLAEHRVLAVGTAALPMALVIVFRLLADTLLVQLVGERKEASSCRVALLGRAKATLPFASALPLLLRFDPDGDHRMLIVQPEQIKVLEGERAQLVAALNDAVAALAPLCGWDVAAATLGKVASVQSVLEGGKFALPVGEKLVVHAPGIVDAAVAKLAGKSGEASPRAGKGL